MTCSAWWCIYIYIHALLRLVYYEVYIILHQIRENTAAKLPPMAKQSTNQSQLPATHAPTLALCGEQVALQGVPSPPRRRPPPPLSVTKITICQIQSLFDSAAPRYLFASCVATPPPLLARPPSPPLRRRPALSRAPLPLSRRPDLSNAPPAPPPVPALKFLKTPGVLRLAHIRSVSASFLPRLPPGRESICAAPAATPDAAARSPLTPPPPPPLAAPPLSTSTPSFRRMHSIFSCCSTLLWENSLMRCRLRSSASRPPPLAPRSISEVRSFASSHPMPGTFSPFFVVVVVAAATAAAVHPSPFKTPLGSSTVLRGALGVATPWTALPPLRPSSLDPAAAKPPASSSAVAKAGDSGSKRGETPCCCCCCGCRFRLRRFRWCHSKPSWTVGSGMSDGTSCFVDSRSGMPALTIPIRTRCPWGFRVGGWFKQQDKREAATPARREK